jgi:hypothetical protein
MMAKEVLNPIFFSGGAPNEKSTCKRRKERQHAVLRIVAFWIVVHQVDEEQEQA